MSDLTFGLLLFGFLMATAIGLNAFSTRVYSGKIRISQEKKNRYLRMFWYFYGVFFLFQGLFDLFYEDDIFGGILWSVIGLVVIVTNYKEKIVPQSTKVPNLQE